MSTTPTCDMTPSEMFDSLTGFDEIAVVKMFGRPITDYGRSGRTPNPLLLVRALIAVHHKRSEPGVKDAAAYAHAMGLTVGQAQGYFTPEPEDDEPEPTPAPGDALELGDDEGKAPSAD